MHIWGFRLKIRRISEQVFVSRGWFAVHTPGQREATLLETRPCPQQRTAENRLADCCIEIMYWAGQPWSSLFPPLDSFFHIWGAWLQLLVLAKCLSVCFQTLYACEWTNACVWMDLSVCAEHVYRYTCACVYLFCVLTGLSVGEHFVFLWAWTSGCPGNCMLESASKWPLLETHLVAHPGAPSSRYWLLIANFCSRSFSCCGENLSSLWGSAPKVKFRGETMKPGGKVRLISRTIIPSSFVGGDC